MKHATTLTPEARARWVQVEQADDSWAAQLPFSYPDVDSTPPVECEDVLMWFIALQMLVDHRRFDECTPSCADCFYAWQGLATACGAQVAMSDYWRGLTAIRRAFGVPVPAAVPDGA